MSLSRRLDKLEALAGDPEPVLADMSDEQLGALRWQAHQQAERAGWIVEDAWGYFTIAKGVTEPDLLEFLRGDVELHNSIQDEIYKDYPRMWIDMGIGRPPYPFPLPAEPELGERWASLEAYLAEQRENLKAELFTLGDVRDATRFDQGTGRRLK